jgi:hypothetical protein
VNRSDDKKENQESLNDVATIVFETKTQVDLSPKGVKGVADGPTVNAVNNRQIARQKMSMCSGW